MGFHNGEADVSNFPVLELLVGGEGTETAPRALHIAASDDGDTDWAQAADAHPTMYIHSSTTPATDYMGFATDAACANINAQGATNLNLQISGTNTLRAASGNVSLMCGSDLTFAGTTGQPNIFLTDALADALSIGISGGSDYLVFKTTNSSEVLSTGVDKKLTGGNKLMTKRTVTTDSTCGNRTWTIAEMLGGLMLRDPVGSDRTDVTPTAALIVAGIPCAAVNDTFRATIVNTANGDCENFTLSLGTDVTMIPATQTAERNEILNILVRLTCVGACEKVTIYGEVHVGT